MPTIGEVKHINGLKYIWTACDNCGKERWVWTIKGQPRNKLCRICGNKVFLKGFKTGRRETSQGYVKIWLNKDNPFHPMTDKTNTVEEHRLVVAQHLGRCLEPWETVHHKGTKYPIGSKEDKRDNRFENLELFPSSYGHNATTKMQNYIKKLEIEVNRLRNELKKKS